MQAIDQALERLVVDKRLADAPALQARKEAWADAYGRTPQGKPVELACQGDTYAIDVDPALTMRAQGFDEGSALLPTRRR